MGNTQVDATDQDSFERFLDTQDVPDPMRDVLTKAARMAKASRRHHVVPAGYLDAWTDDDNLVEAWNTENGNVFPATTANVCAETDFYTTELVTGGQTRIMEGVLAVLDDRYISTVRNIVADEQLPADEDERREFAFALAFQSLRLPQRRRMMNDTAEQFSRTLHGAKMEELGLDPYGFTVDVGSGFHLGLAIDSALITAADFYVRDWTLHIASSDWFATSDVPVLYDYEATPSIEGMLEHPAGRRLIAQTRAAGADLADVGAGPVTADQVLIPLAPHVVLEIGRSRTGRHETVKAEGPVRDEAERLLIRCRERLIIGRPGQRMVQGREGKALPRRRQMRVRCIRTRTLGSEGACTMHTSSVYASEPQLKLCGNHY